MSAKPQLQLDVVSDVVCPWCYIGKRRLENALATIDDVDVVLNWKPYFLNPWIPLEGIDRNAYLERKFGSVDAYTKIAANVPPTAAEEGLVYNSATISRQPNTIDCHRLIHWAKEIGQAGAMKQKLMELYFRDGADLTKMEVLVKAAADCGLDHDDTCLWLCTDRDVEMIAREAQEAKNAGIGGVPTFIFAGKYALSGAYPPDQLAKAIRHVAGVPREGEAAAGGA